MGSIVGPYRSGSPRESRVADGCVCVVFSKGLRDRAAVMSKGFRPRLCKSEEEEDKGEGERGWVLLIVRRIGGKLAGLIARAVRFER